jgi:DNA-binding transcriptional MerR regulator/effector-binding domain-containing protein
MIGNSYLSIKDFSAYTGIKQSTLRYYDDLGLFSPIERGENGYRYYSPQQIITINAINVLCDLDVPVKCITEIERDRSPEKILELFQGKELELENSIRKLQRSYDVVRTLRQQIQHALAVDEEQIGVTYMDDTAIVLGPENDFSYQGYFYEAFLKFCTEAKQYRINLDFPIGGVFPDMASYLEKPSEPQYFFSLDPNGPDEKSGGNHLVGYTRGYYGETGDLPERMRQYAADNDLKFTGPVYNIYLLDEISVKDYHQYLLQASVPVAPKKG